MLGVHADLRAQGVAVRGRVVHAETNAPVSGANVLVKGATAGVLTGTEGEFLLHVRDANATIVVSFIGVASEEVALDGRAEVTVRLRPEAVELQELVVVGYGTQRRSDATGSVAAIPTARLEERANTNIEQALQGAVPGVSVRMTGAGAEPSLSVLIRGRNSITASNDERSRELLSEEHRRYTLVRTGTLVERTKKHNPLTAPVITARDTIFPIPQAVIDANIGHGMTQNPGY